MNLYIVSQTKSRIHFGTKEKFPLCETQIGQFSHLANGNWDNEYKLENGKLNEYVQNEFHVTIAWIENGELKLMYKSFYCKRCMAVIEKYLKESI